MNTLARIQANIRRENARRAAIRALHITAKDIF